MSITKVWTLGTQQDRDYALHLIAQDGDVERVDLIDKSIDIGRKPIPRTGAMTSGRRVATEHLPTKVKRTLGRADEAGGNRLNDVESAHLSFIVTDRFKDVVEDLCGVGTHQFEPVEVVNALKGEDRHCWWFVPAVRLHALDPDKVDPPLNDLGYYPHTAGPFDATITFRSEVVDDHHIFCTAEYRHLIFVSDAFRASCESAGITGADFDPPFPVE